MSDESGRKGGSSFTGKYDTETKTARPTSVGPHHARHEQEDPANKGIDPQSGYANEIAEGNRAAGAGEHRASGPVQIQPKAETTDESGGTEEMLRKSGPARDAPPLSGMAKE
ncbi:hypothetical protein [Falsiroseomonas sp. CW058]|uniref:hypothetical protein n=1 Tax=Falsiroseomonas sp. CW058 TaxID=3388664 RepID=UPI003D318117